MGIGVTNQRETTIVWNKITGLPYHNAIVWNDTRTSKICDYFSILECSFTPHTQKDRFRHITGLPISTYFSAFKLYYLLESVPNLRQDAERGLALFGTVDSWLIWNLTGGRTHATDVTNASRTFLMNIHSLQWDTNLLDFFKVPHSMMPAIRSSSEIYDTVSFRIPSTFSPTISSLFGVEKLEGVPIAGVLGDQHAALFGQACFSTGEAK
jgi:glycerol kinase